MAKRTSRPVSYWVTTVILLRYAHVPFTWLRILRPFIQLTQRVKKQVDHLQYEHILTKFVHTILLRQDSSVRSLICSLQKVMLDCWRGILEITYDNMPHIIASQVSFAKFYGVSIQNISERIVIQRNHEPWAMHTHYWDDSPYKHQCPLQDDLRLYMQYVVKFQWE